MTITEQMQSMLERGAPLLTENLRDWLAFLRISGRVYKYNTSDTMLIYMQCPRATACAERELWEKRMRRRVKPDARGIALLLYKDGKPCGVRYVYNVADTEAAQEAAELRLWRYSGQYEAAVSARLCERFGVPAGKSLSEQLIRIALKLAGESAPATNGIRESFTQAMSASVAYILLYRCSQSMEGVFSNEDFQQVPDFNTSNTAIALAAAVKTSSEAVLLEVERAIKACCSKAA